jgi:hypothetical protein
VFPTSLPLPLSASYLRTFSPRFRFSMLFAFSLELLCLLAVSPRVRYEHAFAVAFASAPPTSTLSTFHSILHSCYLWLSLSLILLLHLRPLDVTVRSSITPCALAVVRIPLMPSFPSLIKIHRLFLSSILFSFSFLVFHHPLVYICKLITRSLPLTGQQ